MGMILAGDIGGTKTNIGLFEVDGASPSAKRLETYHSKDFFDLESILDKFESRPSQIAAACFGVAGPVIDGRSVTPNLPWVVDSTSLARKLRLDSVALINDLESAAHGIFAIRHDEMVTLNEGHQVPGNAALVAAGTGFGAAALFWDGRRHAPSASEGGHADFAPRNPFEIDLLNYLLTKFEHVSVERVVSGPGLYNVYQFLRDTGRGKELPEIAARFEKEDPSSVIGAAGLTAECGMCAKALETVTSVYGAVTGNFALNLKATGGVFIGGGIAPKILPKLRDGSFMKAFAAKGRLTPLLEAMPVRVILNDKLALLGAARVAAEL